MVIQYNNHPIAVVDGGHIISIVQMLSTGDYTPLTKFGVILKEVEDSAVSPTIAFEDEDLLVDLTDIVDLYNSLIGSTDSELMDDFNGTVSDYAEIFEIPVEELLTCCSEALNDYVALTTDEPLLTKAVEPKSIRLKPWIQALNKFKGFVTLSSETVQMSSPESEVIVRLDKANDIINRLDVSTQFAPLYDYNKDMQSVLWRQYGVPEELMIGTGETDYIDILPNEEKLYQQLKQLSSDLAAHDNITPDAKTGECIAVSPLFSDYMLTLIYRAISANWRHTGLHFVITSEEEEVDENDIDESDEDAVAELSKNDNAIQGSNEQVLWTPEEKLEIEKKFLARGRTLKSITSAYSNVKNYITTCNNQQGVNPADTYIFCLLKLLRWGSRRPLRIRIGDMPRSIETDMFQILDDFENSEKKLIEIDGKSLIPFKRVMVSITIPPNLKVKYGLIDTPLMLTTGLMCRQVYEIVDRPGKKIVEMIYVDALNMLDDEFKNGIIGLDYDKNTSTFSLTDETTESIILSKQGYSGGDRLVLGDSVANGSEKGAEYTLPDVLVDTVSKLNLPNKKRAGLNMAYYILAQLSDGNLPEESIALLSKVLPYIKELPKSKSPTIPVSFLDVVNAIVKYKPAIEIPTSNAFEDTQLDNKIRFMDSPNPLEMGYNVRNNAGQVVAYFSPKPVFGIYSLNTKILNTVDHPQLATIDAVVKFVEAKLPAVKEVLKNNAEIYEQIVNSIECLKAIK